MRIPIGFSGAPSGCSSTAARQKAPSHWSNLKPPGDTTPLHVHQRESQTTILLDGEATVPDGPHVLREGDSVHQPVAVAHCEVIPATNPPG